MYRQYIGKSGNIWMVSSKMIYVWNEDNQTGLYGDEVAFRTETGVVRLKGPWCSHAEALHKDTGVTFYEGT